MNTPIAASIATQVTLWAADQDYCRTCANQRARHGSVLLERDFEHNEATLADNEVVVDSQLR